jgi:hypothetical protein
VTRLVSSYLTSQILSHLQRANSSQHLFCPNKQQTPLCFSQKKKNHFAYLLAESLAHFFSLFVAVSRDDSISGGHINSECCFLFSFSLFFHGIKHSSSFYFSHWSIVGLLEDARLFFVFVFVQKHQKMLEIYQKKKKKISKLHEVCSWPIVGPNFLLKVILKNPSHF